MTHAEARARVLRYQEADQELGGANRLNGAQIVAALEIADRVATGSLTVDGGVAVMVESLGVSEEAARSALSGAQPSAQTEVTLGLVADDA